MATTGEVPEKRTREQDANSLWAHNACAECKNRKRKCDKRLPTCSLCIRARRNCDYSWNNDSQSVDESKRPLHKATTTTSRPPRSAHPHVPASCFIYPSSQTDPACPQVSYFSPTLASFPSLSDAIGNPMAVRSFTDRYFQTIHPWFPIIQHRAFEADHFPPTELESLPADVSLVLLVMKLLLWIPMSSALEHSDDRTSLSSKQEPRTADYLLAKHISFDIQISGRVSLRLVQAQILLALYELGHAIHPVASLTVSTATRLVEMLGINRWLNVLTVECPELEGTGCDAEEVRRVIWGAIVLDRISALPYPERYPSTHEPHDSILPIDDALWDGGSTSFAIYRLNDSVDTYVHLSMFACLSLAAHFLGKVLLHVSSLSATNGEMDIEKARSNAVALEAALTTLSNTACNGDVSGRRGFCGPMAVCKSALMLLASNGPQSRTQPSPSINPNPNPHLHIHATSLVVASRRLLAGQAVPLEATTPLLLDWYYRSSVAYLQLLAAVQQYECPLEIISFCGPWNMTPNTDMLNAVGIGVQHGTTNASYSPNSKGGSVLQAMMSRGDPVLLEEYQVLRRALGMLKRKWHAAGVYLDMVQRMERELNIQVMTDS